MSTNRPPGAFGRPVGGHSGFAESPDDLLVDILASRSLRTTCWWPFWPPGASGLRKRAHSGHPEPQDCENADHQVVRRLGTPRLSANRPSGDSGDFTGVPAVQKPLRRRGPNHALQRTEAGGRLFLAFHVVLRQPLSLSLSSLGPRSSSLGSPSESVFPFASRSRRFPFVCQYVRPSGMSPALFTLSRRQHPHSPAGVHVCLSGGPEAPL